MGRKEDLETEIQLEEAPAMSHAQRRKLKKRKRDDQENTSDQEDSPAKTKLKTGKEEGKAEEGATGNSHSKNVPARLHSVWVGNLAFKTTPDDLRTFFKEVEGEITRIKMPRKEGGENGPNKGFAYVDFATSDAKDTAIAHSERPLHGRKLLIKDDSNWQGSHSVAALRDPTTSKPFIMTKTSKSILAKQKQPPCPVLFVGNLPFGATSEYLREHLESHIVIKGKKGKDKEKKLKKTKQDDQDASSSGSESDDEEPKDKVAKKERRKQKEPEILTFEPQEDEGSDSSSEDEEPKLANAGGEHEVVKPSPLKPMLSSKEALGLRAIRLGTFEDTGECKGWAFLDFESAAHATAALLRLPNHYFLNRELKLEFASADAIRRGGYVEDTENPGQYVFGFKGMPSKNGKKSTKRKDMRPPRAQRAQARQEREEDRAKEKERTLAEGIPVVTAAPTAKPAERKSRPKPGSALAMAKRESVAIVPSQGKKVVFG
ncbi:hypothetical protein FRC04_003994 [Tulasnella sp. 424]|nr:hypothetical protein FRC04_003994 [Tulasnella sp. 424]